MPKPLKPSDLSSPPYMLHHKPYKDSWWDVGLAIVIGLILGTLMFNWLAL